MAKKMAKPPKDEKTIPPGQLGDWLDKIPEAVKDAAEEYDKLFSQRSKLNGKLNTAKENVIQAMKDEKCDRCPVRNGAKVLVLDETKKVVYETPKKQDVDD